MAGTSHSGIWVYQLAVLPENYCSWYLEDPMENDLLFFPGDIGFVLLMAYPMSYTHG